MLGENKTQNQNKLKPDDCVHSVGNDIMNTDLGKTAVAGGWAAAVERVWVASGVVKPDLIRTESLFR